MYVESILLKDGIPAISLFPISYLILKARAETKMEYTFNTK